MPTSSKWTRREWLSATAAGSAGALLSACGLFPSASGDDPPTNRGTGRITTPYHTPTGTTVLEESALNLDFQRDGLRYVPANYNPAMPTPLVLMFHGSGGTPRGGMAPFRDLADEAGFILLAPASRDFSWDIRFGAFGPDVEFIGRALDQTYSLCNIDQNRIAVAGFSDGASYALSLGLSNGSLLRRVIAFSPGFCQAGSVQGKPPIFISHGTEDTVLPIATTSRQLVPQFRAQGYDVTYQEFVGPHGVPLTVASNAKDWLKLGW